jgi:hypothetical protein
MTPQERLVLRDQLDAQIMFDQEVRSEEERVASLTTHIEASKAELGQRAANLEAIRKRGPGKGGPAKGARAVQ